MTTYKLLKAMKKVSTDTRVVKNGTSMKGEIERAIDELMEKTRNESFFCNSRAICADSRFYYGISLQMSKKNFKEEFLYYYGYIMDKLIALQIKIGADNVLIVKE